ncbi:MAG: antibiotic biosynthesis monooxygenase [Desulfobacteraceae bacterium]|nr:MAG: antibiotic biosynthesis monooxygenase [Desulfobacteraceae bacterium]
MIVSTVRIAVGAKTREEVLSILFSMRGPTESEPGCISCRIYTEPRDQKHITYEEVWRDEEGFHQHLRSAHYRNLLAAMDLSSEPPEVKFNTVSKTEGIEVVKRTLEKVDPETMRWARATNRFSPLKQDPSR